MNRNEERDVLSRVLTPNSLRDYLADPEEVTKMWDVIMYLMGYDIDLSVEQKMAAKAIANECKRLVEHNERCRANSAKGGRASKRGSQVKTNVIGGQDPNPQQPAPAVQPSQNQQKGDKPAGLEQFNHVSGYHPRRPNADDVKKYIKEQAIPRKIVDDSVDIDALTVQCVGWFEDCNWRNGKNVPISIENYRQTLNRLLPDFAKRVISQSKKTSIYDPDSPNYDRDADNARWSNFYKVECDD